MDLLSAIVTLAIVMGILVYLAAAALQQFLIYHPDRQRVSPKEAGLTNVVEREITTPDGNTVLAWWSPPASGRPSVLYFHGNAGSLADRTGRIRRFQEAGLGIFMMTYRGYGGSTGRPTERDNVADGRRAFDALVGEGIDAKRIFIFGESLGTGVAVQVGEKKKGAGLILDAPYTSLLDLARLHYPYLPAGTFLRDRYDTIRHIENVTMPLLVVHGAQDAIIPISMGEAVLKAAQGQKTFIRIDEAGHLNHDAAGSFDRIISWIDHHANKGREMRSEDGGSGVSGAR